MSTIVFFFISQEVSIVQVFIPSSEKCIIESAKWAIFCQVEIDGRVVQLAAGDSHTVALTEDGRAFGWGSFRYDVKDFL